MKKIIILTLCLILVLGIVIYAKFFIFTYPKLGMEIKSVFENNVTTVHATVTDNV